ncbi:hypothetical protein [Enterococcus asini]|uniref:hypothetical protein n=2 Tax=Enterococcus asini TaxID=57732 RepID=UPI0022E01568|nr:hypothetical protein [Enterococcus asini]
MKKIFILVFSLLITGCSQHKKTEIKTNESISQTTSSTIVNESPRIQKEIEATLGTFLNEDNSVKEGLDISDIEAVEKQFSEAGLNDLTLYQQIEYVKNAIEFYRNLSQTCHPDDLNTLSNTPQELEILYPAAKELDTFKNSPENYYTKLLSWQTDQVENANDVSSQINQIEPSLTIESIFNIDEATLSNLKQLMEKVTDQHLKSLLEEKYNSFNDAYNQVRDEAVVAREIQEDTDEEEIEKSFDGPNPQAVDEAFDFLRENFPYDERTYPYIDFSFLETTESGVYMVEAMSSLARKSVATLVYFEESHTFMKAFDYYSAQ